jgi:N-methylhydantoinase A
VAGKEREYRAREIGLSIEPPHRMDNFLGGRMRLDMAKARAAVAEVAALGQSIEETALAIARIVDNNMVGALRSVPIEGGPDPMDFTLCAFGGATPLHASALIREMAIPRDRAHPSRAVLCL